MMMAYAALDEMLLKLKYTRPVFNKPLIYWAKLAAISRVLLDDTTLLLSSGVSEGCFDGGFVRINDLLSQRLAITHKQPYSVRNIFICQLLSIFNLIPVGGGCWSYPFPYSLFQ